MKLPRFFREWIPGDAPGISGVQTVSEVPTNNPNKDIEGRVYTAFSPYVNHKEAKLLGITADRATVVVKKEGLVFKYGIAICSEHDTFNRAKGKQLAEERLNTGKFIANCDTYKRADETWEKAIIRFANSVAEAALINPGRFKRKICNNCK